jgi:hypothetical protein
MYRWRRLLCFIFNFGYNSIQRIRNYYTIQEEENTSLEVPKYVLQILRVVFFPKKMTEFIAKGAQNTYLIIEEKVLQHNFFHCYIEANCAETNFRCITKDKYSPKNRSELK